METDTSKEQQLNISTWIVLSFVLSGFAEIFYLTWVEVPALLSGIWALILSLYYIRKRISEEDSFPWRVVLSVFAAAFFSVYAYDLLTGHIF